MILYLILGSAISADEVERKADDMANAIAQQNKKVEEESNAMEKAIEEKGKQLDTKEQEDKFEKASKEVDAVGDTAESQFEQKANLVAKLGEDANNAIESQAKKVEALGSKADLTEDNASKMVEDTGKQIEKATDSRETKSRMSISYTVKVPKEPPSAQMVERARYYDDYVKAYTPEQKTYHWPGEQNPPGFYDTQEETTSDIRPKPFRADDVKDEHDGMTHDEYEVSPIMRSNPKKMTFMPRFPLRFPHRKELTKYRRRHFKPYNSGPEKALLIRPTSKSDLGLFVLPSGGPRQLSSDDIKNQFEDDRLLRKAAKQPLSSQEDGGLADELRAGAEAERDMERQWAKINAIGSPELIMHWSHSGGKLGTIGNQQVSVVNPGLVDLLQTEYPEYPEKPGVTTRNLQGINRSKIKKKETVSSKTIK